MMRALALLALWLALSMEGWSQVAVTRGPYLQRATPTGVTIRWRTNVATGSWVLYGPAPGSLSSLFVDAPGTEHSVTLSGLTPGTKYYYAIADEGGIRAGGDAQHYFRTAPPAGSEPPVRIWVLGDSGTGGDTSGRAESVRDAYLSLPSFGRTDVWLMLGDNAYNIGTDAEYQRAVFDTYPSLLRNTVLWSTLGNHDWYADGGTTYANIFTFPQNGEAGGVASGTESYYSFDHANIHFVCLDSMASSRLPGAPMLTWLAQDLAATTQKWIIAFWHHPPYSKGSHDSDWETELVEMRANVLPILEAGGVDLVLGGHSHSYERSFLIDGHYGTSGTLTPQMIKDGGNGRENGTGVYGKDPEPHAGAVYTVCGVSGQVSGGSLNHPVMVTSLRVLGSMVIDIRGDRLDAGFLDSTGVTRDAFSISKAPLVTLSATLPNAAETGPISGAITLSRTRGISQPLTIDLGYTGTAMRGEDYLPTPMLVTIPPNQSSLSIPITPIADTLAEGPESVITIALSGAGYRLQTSTRSATVTIADKPGDDWRFRKFGIVANFPMIAGDAADPDDDGFTNLQERAFGFDPLVSSPPLAPAITPDGFLALAFPRSADAGDLTFRVQVAGTLGAWENGSVYSPLGDVPSNAFTTEVSRTPGEPELITVRDNVPAASAPRRFIRLEILAP
jgi:hypothetical protein